MRQAFGTFLGLPDPMDFMGDGDFVRTRALGLEPRRGPVPARRHHGDLRRVGSAPPRPVHIRPQPQALHLRQQAFLWSLP